ncbi:MAG: hypothetical protein R2695_20790 [Acidimicrobiales bacterium]
MLALFGVGCGRDGSSNSTPTEPPSTVGSTTPEGEPGTTPSIPAEPTTPEGYALTAADIADACASEPLEATEVGITDSTITIEVMADTGSPLAPGLFQGDVDAIVGFAEYINANGGLGCRTLEVRTWDSKFDPTEVKNGQIDACTNAFALVGGNSVFNPDPSTMEGCVDQNGDATGLPNVAAFAVDTNEMCSPMTIGVNTRSEQCPVAVGESRDIVRIVGHARHLLEVNPGLHGVYLANGDLPSTKASAVSDVAAIESTGITWDATIVQSSSDDQAAFIPRVEFLKNGSNFVYNGSADFVTTLFMKEAIAGVNTDDIVWSCGVACYTQTMLSSGATPSTGPMWIPFLPLEKPTPIRHSTPTSRRSEPTRSTPGAPSRGRPRSPSSRWSTGSSPMKARTRSPGPSSSPASLPSRTSRPTASRTPIAHGDVAVLRPPPGSDGGFVRAWPGKRHLRLRPRQPHDGQRQPRGGASELGQ